MTGVDARAATPPAQAPSQAANRPPTMSNRSNSGIRTYLLVGDLPLAIPGSRRGRCSRVYAGHGRCLFAADRGARPGHIRSRPGWCLPGIVGCLLACLIRAARGGVARRLTPADVARLASPGGPIPPTLLTSDPKMLPRDIADLLGDPLQLSRCTTLLTRRGMLRFTPAGLLLHRVPAALLRSSTHARDERRLVNPCSQPC